MDEVYRSIWFDAGCTGGAVRGAAIAIAAVCALMAVIWLIARRVLPRTTAGSGADTVGGARIVFGAMALLGSGFVAYTIFSSTILHRAAFGSEAIELDFCDGLFARHERLAVADVERIDYRLDYRRTRTGPAYDDVAVLRLRTGAAFEIPLRVDPSVSRPEALARQLPRPVIAAWDASVRARGDPPLPSAYWP